MKLNSKERLILIKLSEKTYRSASHFVKEISERYFIPKSTLWHHLRKLKEMNLLDYGGYIDLTEKVYVQKHGLQHVYYFTSFEGELVKARLSSPLFQ